MFLTTIRVRRARPTTMDVHLPLPRLAELRAANATIVELMAHGRPVALATITILEEDEHRIPHATIEWIDSAFREALGPSSELPSAFIGSAVTLMAAAEKAGLTATPEAPEASPVPMPRRKARGPVTA